MKIKINDVEIEIIGDVNIDISENKVRIETKPVLQYTYIPMIPTNPIVYPWYKHPDVTWTSTTTSIPATTGYMKPNE